jgi:hypothetical protein
VSGLEWLMKLLTGRATTPGMSYYRQGDAAGSAQLEGLIEAGEDRPARRVRNLVNTSTAKPSRPGSVAGAGRGASPLQPPSTRMAMTAATATGRLTAWRPEEGKCQVMAARIRRCPACRPSRLPFDSLPASRFWVTDVVDCATGTGDACLSATGQSLQMLW